MSDVEKTTLAVILFFAYTCLSYYILSRNRAPIGGAKEISMRRIRKKVGRA